MNHSLPLLLSVLLVVSCEQHLSKTSNSDDSSLRNRIEELEKSIGELVNEAATV
jgi:hypothetical protein